MTPTLLSWSGGKDAAWALHAQAQAAGQLDATFSGRAFDPTLLAELPISIDPCGEHGEFHTCVFAGPMFNHPIAIARGDSVLRDGRFAYTDFKLPA